jgi:hypothetical protein
MESGFKKKIDSFLIPYAGIIQIRLKGCNLSSILPAESEHPRQYISKEQRLSKDLFNISDPQEVVKRDF